MTNKFLGTRDHGNNALSPQRELVQPSWGWPHQSYLLGSQLREGAAMHGSVTWKAIGSGCLGASRRQRLRDDAKVSKGVWQILARLIPVIALTLSFSAAAADRSITRLDGTKISFTEIDAQVARMMKAGNVSGLGVAILNDWKVAFLKAYGYRDISTRLPLTVDSIMTAASLTKPTFAYAVMQMVEESILN